MLILTNHLTWLPALAYITTFGFELAVDASLANVLFGIYKSPTFGQTKAGYVSPLVSRSLSMLHLTCHVDYISLRPFEFVDSTIRYLLLYSHSSWENLNRATGGIVGDLVYKRFGVRIL